MFIPPEGVYFKIVGRDSGRYILSRWNPEPHVWHRKKESDSDNDPSLIFSLVYGTAENHHKGLYSIKNKATNRFLFSRASKEPHVGKSTGEFYDNFFKFEPGTGDYSDSFRIICPSTHTVLFSRLSQEPGFGNVAETEKYAEQYFRFEYENSSLVQIEYDILKAELKGKTLAVFGEQKLTNDGKEDKEMDFKVSKTFTHTSKFEYSEGFSPEEQTEFKYGIPFVETDGTFSVRKKDDTNTWTFGVENTLSQSYSKTFKVKVGAGKTVHAFVSVQKATLIVPYTMILATETEQKMLTTSGKWTGVTTWELVLSASP